MKNDTSSGRRTFLKGISAIALTGAVTRNYGQSPDSYGSNNLIPEYMQLRPHHILDIISDFGKGITYEPNPFGHSLHLVGPELLSDLDRKITLMIGADAICEGCMHLMYNGQCNDVLPQLTPSPSKQAYNDVLDCRLFDLFGLEVNTTMTTREYLQLVNKEVPGIEEICTHPKEDKKERLAGLIQGLVRLGIREEMT
jgi:hypothetical protein